MTHIYVDTNVFLGFYQAATERLDVFRELVDRADKLLLTQQTILGFRRNRVGRLKVLAQSIRSTSRIPINATAAVRALPAFSAWQAAKSEAQRGGRRRNRRGLDFQ